jgi:hypothetical protein
MISAMTAQGLVNNMQYLTDAEYCLENIDKCSGALTVIVQNNPPETLNFGNIQGHDLSFVFEAIIDNVKTRLDELNRLAVKEADNEK